MLELTPEITQYILLGFGSWVVFGIFLTIWYAKYMVQKTELFAVIFACLWIFTIISGMEVSQYFHIIGLMSGMHLVGEKAVKSFTTFILEFKWVKK